MRVRVDHIPCTTRLVPYQGMVLRQGLLLADPLRASDTAAVGACPTVKCASKALGALKCPEAIVVNGIARVVISIRASD